MSKIQTLGDELATIIAKRKELEIKEGVIKGALLAEMQAADQNRLELEGAVVSVGRRVTFTYTDAVAKLEEKLKLKKVDEEKTGAATAKVTEYLTFREIKNNN